MAYRAMSSTVPASAGDDRKFNPTALVIGSLALFMTMGAVLLASHLKETR